MSNDQNPANPRHRPFEQSLFLFCLPLPPSFTGTDFVKYINAQAAYLFQCAHFDCPKKIKKMVNSFFNVYFELSLQLLITDFSFLLFDDKKKGRKNGGK